MGRVYLVAGVSTCPLCTPQWPTFRDAPARLLAKSVAFSQTPASEICKESQLSREASRTGGAAASSTPALSLAATCFVLAVDGHKERVLLRMLRAQTRTIAVFNGRQVVRILPEIINVLFAHREQN